ncbi:Uncharacterised protein [Vibrio cholerae]|nr:Uncharacterised protein [Vibrio cholerae]
MVWTTLSFIQSKYLQENSSFGCIKLTITLTR